MALLDQGLVLAYLLATLALGLAARARTGRAGSGGASYLLAGRGLTVPAFVATMVSTWYGGILGVGEYSFRYGLSNWLVFGLPYYLAAGVFALLLASRARKSQVLTLPEQLRRAYGAGPAGLGALVVFVTTLPAAYLLTLGVLLQAVFGLPLWGGIVLGTLGSVLYLWRGGFAAVVRTDYLQFGLMFGGFALLVGLLLGQHGLAPLTDGRLPPGHLTWHGGRGAQAIVVWYFIALATLVEPTFYQRCFAARSPRTARVGLLLSIVAWALFDALTTTAGLYARALLTDLPPAEALMAYPRLAQALLPVGLLGLFFVGLLATVMSTVDSYLFVAASTLGRDLAARFRPHPAASGEPDERAQTHWTRVGLVVSALLALGIALASRSVVRIWHGFGTVGTCTLLLPVVGAFLPGLRPSPGGALALMLVGLVVSLGWTLSRYLLPSGAHLLGLEPIYPGLVAGLIVWSLSWGVERWRSRKEGGVPGRPQA